MRFPCTTNIILLCYLYGLYFFKILNDFLLDVVTSVHDEWCGMSSEQQAEEFRSVL